MGECKDVYKSHDDNSCPLGMKIFAPKTQVDWATLLASAAPLRNPHWIVDITRPQKGCGGCSDHPMNSGDQGTWVTTDREPWWLRSTVYTQPDDPGYGANCYLDLPKNNPESPNSVTFDDNECDYHSRSYF